MAVDPHRLFMSVEEYLELDGNGLDARYEYIDGVVTMLAGGTTNHSRISVNMVSLLQATLRGSPCEVFNSNLRVSISSTRYVLPDASVSCDPHDLEGENDIIYSPRVIVEVLSPSTEATDRGKKFRYYQSCPSIQEYVLISTQEQAIEGSLRPRRLSEYIGQEKIKGNLSILLEAARRRNESVDHVLLYGPPGLGKTTLCNIIAVEMGVNLKTTSGPAIEHAGDLASILTSLQAGEVLFIGEKHPLSPAGEKCPYSAFEDLAICCGIRKAPGRRALRLSLPPFLFVSTTPPGSPLTA